jgi:hypothetical protein
MKGLSVLILALALGACARSGSIDPSDTQADADRGNVEELKLGELVVRTETVEGRPSSEAERPVMVHKPYKIYDKDGRFLLHVANRTSESNPEPMTVPLEPGRYIVKLDDADRTFWVSIEDDRQTVVDAQRALEGDEVPPAK